MLCVTAVRLAVLQVALLVLAVPVAKATAPQPLSVVPSAVKATLPVGAEPVTVAVKATLVPAVDGLSELVSVVVEVTTTPVELSVTASMKVVLSFGSVPANMFFFNDPPATENGMLN